VDTYADGVRLKPNELAAARPIKAQFPNDELRLVSKMTGLDIDF